MDLISNFTNCLFCFPSSPNLKINGRTLRLLRLLGEGGFSYVYLVQDTSTSALYALKKIRCPFGQESVALALKEVEAYSLFGGVSGGNYIIHSIDHQVKDEGAKVSGIGGDANAQQKTVYILLPYYRRGNLQDEINANLVNRTRFPERRLMKIMLGVCKGLRAMHHYQIPATNTGAGRARREAASVREQASNEDRDLARQARSNARTMTASAQRSADDEEEQEAPLMPSDAGGEITASQAGKQAGEARAYAHRDIKPANIMLDDGDSDSAGDPKPILMDLGSIAPSPIPITSRSQALAIQDTAAEHSTMPYRAPELFDVKTESTIDTKVDIWSLGCTMYACLIGKSPFEARSDETGGSLSICVLGGDWKWPDENAPKPKRQGTIIEGDGAANGSATGGSGRKYPSDEVREIVRRCLAVEGVERPDVDELIQMIEDILPKLPEGADGIDN